MYTFFYIAYHAVALFYLASGCILWVNPKIMEKRLVKWFPYLEARQLNRTENSVNLIFVGAVLLLVGYWLAEENIAGLLCALILSAWEVYLSMTFYRKRDDTFSTTYHFVIHTLVALLLLDMIFVTNPTDHIKAGAQQISASVHSVFASNK